MNFDDLSNPDIWSPQPWKRFVSLGKKTGKTFNLQDIGGLKEHKNSEAAHLYSYSDVLADSDRVDIELKTFVPEQAGGYFSSNKKCYEYLVLKYGILNYLVRQQGYKAPIDGLIEEVKSWETEMRELGESKTTDHYQNDLLLALAQAAADYDFGASETDDPIENHELHLIWKTMKWHNKNATPQNCLGWEDFFDRQALLGNFPAVDGKRDAHGARPIKHAIYTLTYQALVFDVRREDEGRLIGIPEDFVGTVKEWLRFELTEEDQRVLMNDIDEINRRSTLMGLKNKYDLEGAKSNEERINEIVASKVSPRCVLDELSNSQLADICERYELESGRGKDAKMSSIINHFEHGAISVKGMDEDVAKYVSYYTSIARRRIPKLCGIFDEISGPTDDDRDAERLFEKATNKIFKEVLGAPEADWLGSKKSGKACHDGEFKCADRYFIWDSKSKKEGGLGIVEKTQRKVADYARRMRKDDKNVWAFMLIAPNFTQSAYQAIDDIKNNRTEDLDVLLIRAEDLQKVVKAWSEKDSDKKFPFKEVFNKHGRFNTESTINLIDESV